MRRRNDPLSARFVALRRSPHTSGGLNRARRGFADRASAKTRDQLSPRQSLYLSAIRGLQDVPRIRHSRGHKRDHVGAQKEIHSRLLQNAITEDLKA